MRRLLTLRVTAEVIVRDSSQLLETKRYGVVLMTTIQQVLFKLESEYLGHPYCVTGNALFNAIARRVDARTRRTLHVSHGVFVPGEYGAFPESHSQDGYAGKLGQSLPPVENYQDLFVFWDAAHRWLLDSRPRDAHNVHDLHRHGDRLAVAPTCWFSRPPEQRNSKRSVSWYVHCYFHDGGSDEVVPLADSVLDGLQVGDARNYEFGELSLADTQCVDLADLDYSRVREASDVQLRLVTPYVLASSYSGADSQSVPSWWTVEPGALWRRQTRLVAGESAHDLATIDHGQVVRYAGDDAVRTAKNGIRRIGTHAKYGFGELRVRPVAAGDLIRQAVGGRDVSMDPKTGTREGS